MGEVGVGGDTQTDEARMKCSEVSDVQWNAGFGPLNPGPILNQNSLYLPVCVSMCVY